MSVGTHCAPVAAPPTLDTAAPPRTPRLLGDSLVVFVVALLGYLAIFAYLDNTNINTTNGLWKSLEVKKWVDHSPDRHLHNANALLFPLTGFLARQMPDWTGPLHRRMALLNCFYGAVGVASVFALLRGLGTNRIAATCGAIFQAGCAFYLICAITTEDIMPAVAFLTMACAVVACRWDRLTHGNVFLAAQPFSLAWLFEWRLLVPSLPAFLLAIAVAPSTFVWRLRMLGTFLLSALVPAVLMASYAKAFGLHNSIPTIVRNLIFVNKGLNTGYAGWAWKKVLLMYVGIQEYLLNGRNFTELDSFFEQVPLAEQLTSWGVILALLVAGLWFARRHWDQAHWRSTIVVLGTIFGCAEGFNLYSQPQDPQMQMNAMLWLAVVWGVAIYAACVHLRTWPRLAPACCLALSACPLIINTCSILPYRGQDSASQESIQKLAAAIPPDHTVIVHHGFEGFASWIAALKGWDHYGQPTLKTSEGAWQTWKMLSVAGEATTHPRRSPEESSRVIQRQINSALDQGVRVVIDHIWEQSEEQFIASWCTISGPEKPREVYRMLKREYEAVPLISQDASIDGSPFFELHRKSTTTAQDFTPREPFRH